MFCKHDRSAAGQPSTEHRLKERRALMSMQDLRSFTIREGPQPPGTASVDAGLPVKMFHDEAILRQSLTDLSDFIQNSNHTAELIVHPPHHEIHKHFRPAHAQRMDDIADRRAAVGGRIVVRSGLDHWAGIQDSGFRG